MADGAILVSGAAQIMKCGRHSAEGRIGTANVGMALQTNDFCIVAGQHPRMRGPVRLMACRAAVRPHGFVLINERSPLIAMALKTTGLIPDHGSGLGAYRIAVWIVTIDATHSPFR